MTTQFDNFKDAYPTGVVQLNTISTNYGLVIQANVYKDFPKGLSGSAQALITDVDLFEEAEVYVTKTALQRAGFEVQITEEEVEAKSTPPEEELIQEETTVQEEVPQEEPIKEEVKNTTKASTAEGVKAKYAHLFNKKKA